MLRFSRRYGYKKVREQVQHESLDKELRNGLWSSIYESYLKKNYFHDPYGTNRYSEHLSDLTHLQFVATQLWRDFFKYPVDELSDWRPSVIDWLKRDYSKLEWFEVFDLLEFLANVGKPIDGWGDKPNYYKTQSEMLIGKCNSVLEEGVSAYRFVNEQITEICGAVEIDSIQNATDVPGEFSAAAAHIGTSLAHFSNRTSPDYRNSIKESISAVESVCKVISGNSKASLRDALKEIEKGGGLHGSLREGLVKLYGYTSDEGGIRHALLERTNITADDARFMLVACSAFVNYLISRQAD